MRIIYFSILIAFTWACNNGSTEQKSKVKKVPVEEGAKDSITIKSQSSVDSVFNVINNKIKSDINNESLYVIRSGYYELIGDREAAKADLDRAINLDSTNLDVLIAYADYFLKQGKLRETLGYLEKARKYHPSSSSVYLKLGELFIIAKNNKKSLENADLAIKYDKFNAKAYYLKGFNFLEIGDTAKAISSYRTAVEQDPEHFESYMQLAMIFNQKDDPLALDYFNNALEIKPNHREAMYGKAMFQQEHEMYNEALSTYHEVLKAHPDFKEAHYNLGYVHMFYLQLYRQASLHFTDAIEVAPNYYQAYYNRGYSFELMGDIRNAEKDYLKALEINPSYDRAAQGLSRVREEI